MGCTVCGKQMLHEKGRGFYCPEHPGSCPSCAEEKRAHLTGMEAYKKRADWAEKRSAALEREMNAAIMDVQLDAKAKLKKQRAFYEARVKELEKALDAYKEVEEHLATCDPDCCDEKKGLQIPCKKSLDLFDKARRLREGADK